ncbi:hypothetical protein Q8G40_28660, partial [Klebsiella pneumoniae]|uniref:hypothetical protein n=1 Tax=Klebsiella pneumoniae TaxID=573 RepID=UPI0030140D90
LIVNTHLQSTGFLPVGSSVISHVPFFFKALISSSIATFHSGISKASLYSSFLIVGLLTSM